ncbi:beta-ketoacyl-ACP synthase II [Pseudoruminococcus massiliensis]|uniref:beta-ketoacyl-ACP synthase II n=1 Tax=Pseudoruminococcus massiliensis TaxID=2086583 RepID=UPI000D0E551D|nr:beta-ketoacyl-ACP synthase II [Pseudoruminococcus massiliensis]
MRRVVITGIGAVTPVGNDIETMWNSLVNGKNGIDYIKSFDTEKLKVKVAAEVKDFDPTKYIEKKELRKTDLFCQYAIAAACQAVEDSGIIGTIEDEKLGVYVGSGTGGMHTFFTQCENMIAEKKISPFFIPMMIGNMAAGLIAIRFSAKGPCLPVVTACATSTHAVGEAFHAIKNGYADAIITGGAEAAITPLAIAGFSSCMALSTRNDPNSSSIPFDKRRDGFVMGEGAGILVLEEYEHAVARGAKIYAEVAGYGNTCDAHHVTAPDPEAAGAARCVEIALKEAGITDDDTLYINAHGTSTPANDKTETAAFKRALGEKAYDAYISSTKSMTGHMLGATGAVEAIVAALAVKNGIVPPTIGLEEPDPECDLNYVPNKAVEAPLTAAASTTFGFGGHNACIALKKVSE